MKRYHAHGMMRECDCATPPEVPFEGFQPYGVLKLMGEYVPLKRHLDVKYLAGRFQFNLGWIFGATATAACHFLRMDDSYFVFSVGAAVSFAAYYAIRAKIAEWCYDQGNYSFEYINSMKEPV